MFTAAPGETNRLYLSTANGGDVRVQPYGATTTAEGCFSVSETEFICSQIATVEADLGDGDDSFRGGDVSAPMTLGGGAGDDDLWGGAQADTLNGGAGDDWFTAGAGDTLSGGSGIDGAGIGRTDATDTVIASLDGIADDGGYGANLLPDIEDVAVEAQKGARISGTAAANSLWGSAFADTIVGGPGADLVAGGRGDDTIDARDGAPDRVDCGTGADTVIADNHDAISETCESVQVGTLTSVFEDAPPTVAWTASGGSTLQATATDDHGVVSVQFFDDDRVICTDSAAPFTCPYAPNVADVGANTLTVVANDASGQTASAVTARRVARFKPRAVSLNVKREGSRTIASGKVTLPAGIACSGTVTVAGRTTKLSRTCSYRVRVPRATRYTARYSGTDAIEPKRSATRRPR